MKQIQFSDVEERLQQEKAQMEVDSIQMQAAHDRRTDPELITMEVHSIFGPNTPVLVEDQVMSLYSMHLGYSARETVTLGIDPKSQTMKYCHMLEIPQELYVHDSATLKFGPGFTMECIPNAVILTGCDEGYKFVKDLKPGDTVLVTKYNRETRTDFIEKVPIERVYHPTILLTEHKIKKPMYALISEYHNVFLPFEEEGTPIIWFINFRQ